MNMQRLLESLSLFVLLSVVMLRPLITESYDSAGNPMTAALGQVSDPSPVRTLVLDVLILAGTCGWLVARAIGPVRRYRWTGIEWGAALVTVAALVSCFFAGNKRLAINASMDWLCLPLLAICLVQLMHRSEHRRLLLAVILASACVQAFQCIEQVVDGFEGTWNHYQGMKEEFWARQGVPLDSDSVELFERRMRAWEAHGFLQHSNVAGAYLVLCGFAAAGWALAAWRDAGRHHGLIAAGGAMVTATLFVAAYFTRSLGALLSAIAGLLVWIIVVTFASRIRSHRRTAFLIGWSCVILGGLVVVGYGLHRGSLPNTSLNFRWQYWRASAELVADHLWTGVGRENFGRHYLKYKPIESPEEISNPHNLFVQAASDWGVVGLTGVAMMLLGGSWMLIRSPLSLPGRGKGEGPKLGFRHSRESGNPPPPFLSVCFLVLWTASLLAVLVLGRLPLLGTTDRNFLYYSSVTTVLVWLPSFLLFNLLPTHERSPGAHAGATVGLLTFLLHDLINFALFTPGSATTFFALFAFCISESTPATPLERISSARRWMPVAGVMGLISVVLWLGLIPVAWSAHFVSYARLAAVQPSPRAQPDAYYLRAVAADPFDPTPHLLWAQWLAAQQAGVHRASVLQHAADSMTEAMARDPFHAGLRRQQMQLYRSLAGITGSTDHHQAAIDAGQEALELYPLDPEGIAALADAEAEAAPALRSDALIRSAIANYQRALAVDGARPEWERIRGLSPRQRRAIENRISELAKKSSPAETTRDRS